MYAHVAADHGLVDVHEGRDWSPETARRRVSRPEGRYSTENSQCTLKVSEKATLTGVVIFQMLDAMEDRFGVGDGAVVIGVA